MSSLNVEEVAAENSSNRADFTNNHLSEELSHGVRATAAAIGKGRRVLIIVENLPVPFDRRVWAEATALARHGYEVSVICPKGHDAYASHEVIEGVHIFRHWLPAEGKGIAGYVVEYAVALFWEALLSFRILATRGFDVIHACNPPDLLFLLAGFHKAVFGKRFVFDHHDINPELYEAKFGKRDIFWRFLMRLERWTFQLADVSLATNDSYRAIAIDRGGKNPEHVFVVRSGPSLNRVRSFPPDLKWKAGRKYLVAYVGVIGKQEGLDLLMESISHIHSVLGRDDAQFVIVGSGPELDAVKRLSANARLNDVVTFTGRIDDSTLFTILSTADVCVNPDRPNAMNDKSTMNKILEYMALGKPIVQYDLTEGRVSAGDASLYARNTDTADFGEKIVELLDNPERRRKMGALGQERVSQVLAWKYEEPKLLEAFRVVLDEEFAASAKRKSPLIPIHTTEDTASEFE